MSLYGYRSVSGVGLGSGAFGNLNVATPKNFPKPAAGADFTLTVPDVGQLWRIVTVHLQIVTSSAAANRVFNFNIKDHDGQIVYEVGFATAITASLTIPITLTSLVASAIGDVSTTKRVLLPLPDGPYLPGWTINSVTSLIDTGDQYSGLIAWVIADQPLEDRYDYNEP